MFHKSGPLVRSDIIEKLPLFLCRWQNPRHVQKRPAQESRIVTRAGRRQVQLLQFLKERRIHYRLRRGVEARIHDRLVRNRETDNLHDPLEMHANGSFTSTQRFGQA